MKIECVESLAPAAVPDIPIVPAAAPLCSSRGNRTADGRPIPYRKILVTCDARSTVDPNLVRIAVSAFVKDKVNSLIKEECIVRLHWNGVDVNSIFLRSMEPLTPEQAAELKRTSSTTTSYQVDVPNRPLLDIRPQLAPIAPTMIQELNGATSVAITIPTSVVSFRSAAPRCPAPVGQVSTRPAIIRNAAPQLLNIPVMRMVPVGPGTSVRTLHRGRRAASIMPTIATRPPPTILRSPARPELQQPLVIRTPVQLPPCGPSSAMMAPPPPFTATRPLMAVPVALRAAVRTPASIVAAIQAPPAPPTARFVVQAIRPTTVVSRPAPTPVMVRFNGRVQAAQPGQLIRRTSGQIVRVMPNGSLEDVELPVSTPKQVTIKSSREKPISLDSDSEGEQSQPTSSLSPGPVGAPIMKRHGSSAHGSRDGSKKTSKPHVVHLVNDSTSDSEEDSSTDSCDYIGIDDLTVEPGAERRSQRIAATKANKSVTEDDDSQLVPEANESEDQGNVARPSANQSDDNDNNSKSSSVSNKECAGDTPPHEIVMRTDGVVERVPLIKDASLLQPEFSMTIGDKELTDEVIEKMVEKGDQFSRQYAPQENCRFIFRDADELDFMDTVIVQDDGEVKLDPELYQSYMQIVYKELLADHHLFEAEQERRGKLAAEGRHDAGPRVPDPDQASVSEPLDQPSSAEQGQKKRGRPPKRPPPPSSLLVQKAKLAKPQPKSVRKGDPDRSYSVHYVAANGTVKMAKTTDEVRTRQCYVIMDRVSDYRIAERIANDSDGRLKLRQQDGTRLPLDKLFTAKSKEHLYYDHERGSVDLDRKRGYNWDCVLRPILDRSRGVRYPVRMYSYRHRPGPGAFMSMTSANRDKAIATTTTGGSPTTVGTTAATDASAASTSCSSANLSVRPLTMETRKKEIFFVDSDEDDYVDVDAVGKPSPEEKDDSWEAGTSDEDWDIQDTRVTQNRKRRSKSAAIAGSASGYFPMSVHPSGKSHAGYSFFQPTTSAETLDERLL